MHRLLGGGLFARAARAAFDVAWKALGDLFETPRLCRPSRRVDNRLVDPVPERSIIIGREAHMTASVAPSM